MASHPHRATIEPVPSGVDRPLWSVMIPTYNCARYLSKTLESVLAQDPGPEIMQIEVVDDCSTKDDPAEVVRSVGRGRVGFYRQPQNRGHVRNFETCLKRSRGRLIHQLHGDDYVQYGFYRTLGAAFETHPEVGLAACRQLYARADGHWFGMSSLRQQQSGIWDNALEELTLWGGLQTPSVVVRRECYEALGGFDERLLCTEDYEMWVRIASRFAVWYETECLAVYRFHPGSNSARDASTAESIRDARRAMDIIAEDRSRTLPPDWQHVVLRRLARASIALAENYLDERRFQSAVAALREAFRCTASLETFARAVWCVLRAMVRSVTRRLRPEPRVPVV
jgi:glycosyltransferase involved in cell wall biosynthesis